MRQWPAEKVQSVPQNQIHSFMMPGDDPLPISLLKAPAVSASSSDVKARAICTLHRPPATAGAEHILRHSASSSLPSSPLLDKYVSCAAGCAIRRRPRKRKAWTLTCILRSRRPFISLLSGGLKIGSFFLPSRQKPTWGITRTKRSRRCVLGATMDSVGEEDRRKKRTGKNYIQIF